MSKYKTVEDIVDKVYFSLNKKYSRDTLLYAIRHVFWCTKFCIKNPFLPRILLEELITLELKEDDIRGKLRKIKEDNNTLPTVKAYYDGLIRKINEFIYKIPTN